MCVCVYVCMYVVSRLCMYVWMYVCMLYPGSVCMYVCMYVCIYVCMYACMYVCMYVCMCVWQSCVWKMVCVCESDVSATSVRHRFFAGVPMSSARHAASLRTWNGRNEVCHDLLCSMWCNEMFFVTAAPVLQPRIRRWWHRGKVPGRKSVEHECSWLWTQLWKTRTIYLHTECMPVKLRHSHSCFHLSKSGKHHGYDATCAVFSQTCQPHAVWLRLGSLQLRESDATPSHCNRCRQQMYNFTSVHTPFQQQATSFCCICAPGRNLPSNVA